ncbi:hypothetical protein CL621_00065 [archaeon]|jgi:hypothetical protein|nr:hypothetical protein [archaeon]
MKEVEYKCNLCRRVTDKVDLMSVYYYSNTNYRLEINVDKSDAHICIECIDMIRETKEENLKI